MAGKYSTRKPYPSFPLTPRADGRFAKRIRGTYYTYGANGDWKKALDEYLLTADARHKGRPDPLPAEATAARITVRQLANRYLAEREHDVGQGALTLGAWDDYRAALDRFVKFVGANTAANSLRPDDFTGFARQLGKDLGSYAYNRTRALIGAWLTHAAKAEWIPPVNIGVGFRKIPAGKMRAEKKVRLMPPEHIKLILAAAEPQMKAMIYLALNGGFGSTDCAKLTRDKIDLEHAVARYRRTKTNIPRTIPLWPETVDALKTALAIRPNDQLAFRTHHGNEWVRTERRKNKKGKVVVVTKDAVVARFNDLMEGIVLTDGKRLKDLYQGVGFYVLRHVHSTYANEVRDADARRHILGRKLAGLDDVYIETIFLPRLRMVTDHVRQRVLFSAPLGGTSSAP